ncbi:ferritin-like domain-containing protein [Arcticibacter sp.]|uniref:ferritin-like domain-containing protein n=1 Tax=Arcticibacter sp. TaxID=1872630 RepID=UPI00388F950C
MTYSENYNKQLQRLYKILKDGQKGYTEAAEHVKSPDLRELFAKIASEREGLANQMGSKMAEFGYSPDMHDDALGVLHRGWMNFKASMTSNTDQNILESCRNGDQAALDAFDDVLQGEILYDTELKSFLMEPRLKINETFVDLDKRYFDMFKKDPSL